MDDMIDENVNNINNNSVDNQMNTNSSFGKKRFFNRRLNSEPNDTNVSKLESKKGSNKWSNNSLNNSNNNGLSIDLNGDKFSGDGIQFNAKLIGHEFVAEARGEHMCQQSIKKLKILQRGIGGHKRRVHIFISLDGIKIRDANTSELVYHHSVPQISFISRDETDSRAFGYVFGSSTTGHQFIALKTQKEAMPIMSSIGQLFAVTLKKKKNEIIEESVVNDAINIENEEMCRRESSITLRPRSESPNVPSMPAPPPPTVCSVSLHEEPDFFTAFEPIDSVFETDFKVNKEKLDQMPISDVVNSDPFASSFGSMSLSSSDWANFDGEDNFSSNASLQQSNNSFGDNLKNNSFGIPIVREVPKTQISSSFSDSSNSMALKELFASGHQNHNQHNTFSEFNTTNSEAMAIPQRNRPNIPTSTSNNQSVGSTSSADRYACFTEIHSISSSIFDSLCDQIASEDTSNPMNNSNTSKSLNSSLNGGFGFEHQLSSSYNTTGNYFSFDNPLNNSHNNSNKQIVDKFDTNSFSYEPNAQNWNNNNANPLSNVWSTSSSASPSEKSVANSQWSSASSPPHSNNYFNNRSNDIFSEAPVFAELDPLAKDKPFVDKTLFFADQKQKPTLRDLNSELSSNSGSTGSNSPTIIEQNYNRSQELSSRAFNVNVNPFNDNKCIISGELERCSPNPFNPFNTIEPNSRPTPPTPPPRPPSRECPPVPPRNDLIRGSVECAPPLPRRRTTIDPKVSLESQQLIPNRSVDPFISHNNNDNTSPPPIPNPLRKSQPKSNSNWDPFNCSYIESQLSSIATNCTQNKVINIRSDTQLTSSTPKSDNYVPPLKRDLKLSQIQPEYNWIENNDEINKHSNNSSVFGDDFVFNNNINENNSNKKDEELSNNSIVKQIINTTEDNISPPERNIFIPKSDPFADDFFAN